MISKFLLAIFVTAFSKYFFTQSVPEKLRATTKRAPLKISHDVNPYSCKGKSEIKTLKLIEHS